MSSFGLAQFGLAANNSFNKEKERLDDKKEAAADKLYDRGRQFKSDQRAEQAERRTQESYQLGQESAQRAAEEEKSLYKTTTDARALTTAVNQVKALQAANDHMGALDVVTNTTNANSRATWNIGVERDSNNSPVVTYNEAGEAVYNQNVYDKISGEVISTSPMTLNQMLTSLGQLNNGQAIDQANAAAAAKRAEKVQDNKDELTLYTGKKSVDLEADGINKQRDYVYKVDEMGVKHGYTIDELGVKHGYTIDELGVRHSNAVDLANVNAQNNIGIRTAQSDLDAGGTPTAGGGRNDGSVAGIIASLTGTESGGNSGANRTNSDGRSFGGLLQMGDARLADYARATGSKPISAMQFKNLSASQQKSVNNWHIQDLTKKAQATGAVGRVINGVPVTLGGLVAVAHLGGSGGMEKFVSSNGRYNPKDQLGTSLTDYLKKHASGGISVQRTVPAQPKQKAVARGASATSSSTVTAQTYNTQIDKGVDTSIKIAKAQLGIKPDASTTATFTRAGRLLKSMATAGTNAEFISLYGQAGEAILSAIPERDLNKLTKQQRNDITHKVLLSMTGASSLGDLKRIVYTVNPTIRGSDGAGGGAATVLPGQQARTKATQTTPTAGNQNSKLQALSFRGKPAAKNAAAESNYKQLKDISQDIDW